MDERIKTILEHMHEDAVDVTDFTSQAASFEDFSGNRLLRKGAVMSLLNIGELASHMPPDYIEAHWDVPWKGCVYLGPQSTARNRSVVGRLALGTNP
ncbi:MAG: hypothetical protein LBK98_09075 [Peptococcaceae bacterium]|jgi:uncharacterized protein with HEPN domain|nr:hypothetical protein [Peptococcaceae bacterium]